MAAISLSLDDIATIVSFLKDVWDVCNDVNSSYGDFTTLMGDARNMSACKSLQDALATDGSTLQTLGIDQDMADNIKTVAVNSDEYVEGLLRTASGPQTDVLKCSRRRRMSTASPTCSYCAVCSSF